MAEPQDTIKGNTTGRGANYYKVIQGDFKAAKDVADKVGKKSLGLQWSTNVEAGNIADQVVARKKGFRLEKNRRTATVDRYMSHKK